MANFDVVDLDKVLDDFEDDLDGEEGNVALDLQEVQDEGQEDADEIQHHRPTDGAQDASGHGGVHGSV